MCLTTTIPSPCDSSSSSSYIPSNRSQNVNNNNGGGGSGGSPAFTSAFTKTPLLLRRKSSDSVSRPTDMLVCLMLVMLGFQASFFAYVYPVEDAGNSSLRPPNFVQSSMPLNNTKIQQASDDRDPLAWTNPWTGLNFKQYKNRTDEKIKSYRHKTSLSYTNTCEMPLYDGEFGYELAGMIPWAYHKSIHNDCKMKTRGRPGTKYLYYFSYHHSIEPAKPGRSQRESHRLPRESPLGETPHFGDDQFPTKADWTPPPYKQFFTRKNDIDVLESLDKPLLILSNKYTMEWSDGPTNHIPLETLWEILKFLTPRYHIVYNRFKDARLEDRLEAKIEKNGGVGPYGDKEMIKRFFPSVVLFEELSQNLETDDVNLLMFSLSATADKFISVQGGNSVVASFFGGTNVIHCVRGPEINYHSDHGGDFSYYHRFSNATIEVAKDAIKFCHAVKQHTALDKDDLDSLSRYCTGGEGGDVPSDDLSGVISTKKNR